MDCWSRVKINAGGLKLLDRVEQVNERTAEPINRPGHHNVEFAPLSIMEHHVKTRSTISALRARYAGVAILLDNLPATALSDLAQLPHLIFHRLLVGATRT
jgi:hypothetical protein